MQHPSIITDYPPASIEPIKAHRPPSRHVPRETKPDMFALRQFRRSTSPAALPTSAGPGTEAKVEVLAERYAAELPLWHPHDCCERTMAMNGLIDVEFEGEE